MGDEDAQKRVGSVEGEDAEEGRGGVVNEEVL